MRLKQARGSNDTSVEDRHHLTFAFTARVLIIVYPFLLTAYELSIIHLSKILS
jgi:hypothetical protein